MLQSIRDRATGWIAWVIVILIIIPFAFWGVDRYLQNDAERLVASVDDNEIPVRQFRNTVEQQKQRLRAVLGQVDPELFERPEFKRELLERMISEELLASTVTAENYRVPDAILAQKIQFTQAFRDENGFNAERYERVLRNQGESPASFEMTLRQTMAMDQLKHGVEESALALPAELDALIRLDRQQREVEQWVLTLDTFRDPAQVGDADIQAYFDANAALFRTPERVKLAYLELSVAELAKRIEVDDVALHEYFEANRDRYVRPEQREAAHLLITVPPDADEATAQAARERIAGLRLQLDQGADFVTLAQADSDDVSTAGNGGMLGIVDRGSMGDEFDRVLYSMQEGEISDPIRTDFGWHLVKVVKIHPGGNKSFEEVRDQVAADYRRQQAEDAFYQVGEQLADASYANSDNLQVAADKTGLSVQTSELLTRDGAKSGVFADPKVINAAFSDDVLNQGRNSDVIELASDHVVVVRALEHDPAHDRSLDEVRDEVRDRVATEQAAERIRAAADDLVKRIAAGETPAADGGVRHVEPTWHRRGDPGLDPAVALAAFRLPRPADGRSGSDIATLPSGDIAVVVVHGIKDGDLAGVGDELRKTYATTWKRVNGERAYNDLIRQLRSEREIKIYSENL